MLSRLSTLLVVTSLEHVDHGHRNDNLGAVASQPPLQNEVKEAKTKSAPQNVCDRR